jgi:hypothetical protein
VGAGRGYRGGSIPMTKNMCAMNNKLFAVMIVYLKECSEPCSLCRIPEAMHPEKRLLKP